MINNLIDKLLDGGSEYNEILGSADSPLQIPAAQAGQLRTVHRGGQAQQHQEDNQLVIPKDGSQDHGKDPTGLSGSPPHIPPLEEYPTTLNCVGPALCLLPSSGHPQERLVEQQGAVKTEGAVKTYGAVKGYGVLQAMQAKKEQFDSVQLRATKEKHLEV